MRSHLTRRVFRRLISNQPVVVHCQYHRYARPLLSTRQGRVGVTVVPQRTFFGLFDKPQRDLREPLLDPGMEKMLELDKRIHLIARLPPTTDLAAAFKAFVNSKSSKGLPIEDFHAERLLQTLRSIEDRKGDEKELALQTGDLLTSLKVMEEKPGQAYTSIHNELARALWTAIRSRLEVQESQSRKTPIDIPEGLLNVLCATGDSVEARNIVEKFGAPNSSRIEAQWAKALAGLSQENNEAELLRTLDKMQALKIGLSASANKNIALYYARKDNVEQTKKWFDSSLLHIEPVDGETTVIDDDVYQSLLEFCLRNNEMAWAQTMLQSPNQANSRLEWDAILRAAAVSGRGVDEIERMMNIMNRRAEESGQPVTYPDIDMFNSLIRIAVSKRDSYTAERYFRLAEKWNAPPNGETYILQVEYRLAAGDLDGATAAYAKLRGVEIEGDQDWAIMNKLIQKLAITPRIQNEVVMALVEDLSDRKRTFPAETVLALCKYHLQRDEYFEVVDLLQTYAYQFSTAQRKLLCDVLVEYTLDPATDTGRAWDTYMIFHQVFDQEAKRDARNKVMTSMFDRGRPDLGTHVFTRMSKHMRRDTRPDVDTYVRALEGIAKTGEAEALEVVHNLLKLDTETEPCTRLSNGLVLAYAACDAPVRGLEYWDDIATSAEGPTYNSLHIVFRACEKAPFGYRRAMPIWKKLRQADIEIDKELFASYVGCLAGQSQFDELHKEIDRMEEVVGHGPDTFTIGSIYNALNGSFQQDELRDWCMQRHPDIWEKLEASGIEEDDFGRQRISGIDRSVRA